ncbi:chloride transporter ClC family protein [Oceanimonas sp. GK1]|uniref:chloride channel protein n=1 Tax=Oceanimonas sp. (strain GK1 / IBRC-M 10197) TaxID=511062 RepID=UPI0002494D2A|nr:chloride channel protein [Oceanimonas sp. GK1]AEY00562.1 chloride transporter ClC family protein [Oceanimonas sp. GK1]
MMQADNLIQRLFARRSGSLLPLVLLGVMTGIIASLVMMSFLLLLNATLDALNGKNLEDFEALSWHWRLGLPLLGSVLLILLYRLTPPACQSVGLAYVLERLQFGQGRLPAANIGFQFVAALIALGSGHSVGREGPAVHLGAGIASQIGQLSGRPPSQLRLLLGCGTAAAISAAFNTPLAGVLFAMEVVLMEYSLLGFAPIIAAAITASALTGALLGEHAVLAPVSLSLASYSDMPGLLLTGLWVGLLAALFQRLVLAFIRFPLKSRAFRLLLAGGMTGALALAAPQILGSGYDTINATLGNQLPWLLLLGILGAKLLATAAAIGLGVPGGQIAPTLMLGVCAGGVAGTLLPGASDPALYALLGMAAMMSAVLHAPLAAIATVLELSLSAEAMLPAMVVVLGANLLCQHGFHLPSLVITQLRVRGRELQTHPLRTALAQRYLSELADMSLVEWSGEGAPPRTDAKALVVKREQGYYLLNPSQLEPAMTPETLTALLTPAQRLKRLERDMSLLEALRILQGEGGAGFLVPVRRGRGLVTRSRLMHMLTEEGGLY